MPKCEPLTFAQALSDDIPILPLNVRLATKVEFEYLLPKFLRQAHQRGLFGVLCICFGCIEADGIGDVWCCFVHVVWYRTLDCFGDIGRVMILNGRINIDSLHISFLFAACLKLPLFVITDSQRQGIDCLPSASHVTPPTGPTAVPGFIFQPLMHNNWTESNSTKVFRPFSSPLPEGPSKLSEHTNCSLAYLALHHTKLFSDSEPWLHHASNSHGLGRVSYGQIPRSLRVVAA